MIGDERASVPVPDTTAWRGGPLVVAGTGGTGMRAVSEILVRLGVYMHPNPKDVLFEMCFNEALDNSCMAPTSALGEATSAAAKQQARQRSGNHGKLVAEGDSGEDAEALAYVSWLRAPSCDSFSGAPPGATLEPSPLALRFVNSVPLEKRASRRWGFQSPKAM